MPGEDSRKYDELTDAEKIERNGRRGKKILDLLGGYDRYRELVESDVKSDLKDEIEELTKKMADLGIMTIEEMRDPARRAKFRRDHPETPETGPKWTP